MTYIITDGVMPVTAYASTLHVYPNGADKSVVVWEGSFQAKASFDEKTASDAINGVYDSGLNNLKKYLSDFQTVRANHACALSLPRGGPGVLACAGRRC